MEELNAGTNLASDGLAIRRADRIHQFIQSANSTREKSLLRKDSFDFRRNGYRFFDFRVIADHDRFGFSKNLSCAIVHLVAEIETGIPDLVDRDRTL